MTTASAKNYYELLGVAKDASQEDIRKAYRKLAKKYHPDVTGGDKASEEKLKEINAAYDTLKNPGKRKEYDQMMFEPFRGGADFRGFDGGRGPAGGFEFDAGSFEDLFGDLFGGGRTRSRPRPRKGNDIEASLSVTLREAALGTKKTIRVPRTIQCTSCGGSGAAPGSKPVACPLCKGTGRSSANGGAQFFFSQECPRCRGTGEVVSNPCPSCQGAGQVNETSTVTVAIPAGADTGTRLRLAGQGEAGERGAPNGDLYIVLQVQRDPFFERRGNDLIVEAPISFPEAVLGGTIRVPTLTGKVELTIPPSTQNGALLRMRGLGVPSVKKGKAGDLLVRAVIETPKTISAEARAHLEKFRDAVDPSSYPKRRTFESKRQR